VTRVFLDANILFSAAWRETNGILVLWDRPDLDLVSSNYAVAEAARNIQRKNPAGVERLARLVNKLEISKASSEINPDHGLPEKDVPILQAAIGAKCAVLLTGDVAHFGHMFGKEVEGVRVLTVSMYMSELA
jgi:predicted nucleic acid-binding protein